MKETASMARSYPGVRLHTHLAENQMDIQYSRAQFKMTPGEYAESLGWVGDDVWHAHCVHLDDPTIKRFAQTGTGVAHCPQSNMRLGSGIAPIRKMINAGVLVGLGVDGAASNDASNLLHEARAACLLARVGAQDAAAMNARQALELATLGGARVLGRNDVGYLAKGMAADFIAVNIDKPSFAGAQSDPVAALILCEANIVDYSFIHGRKVVDQGQLTVTDLGSLTARTHNLAKELLCS
jgi:cytosine/adenosine deaminase-related metal-dependent hydrolase